MKETIILSKSEVERLKEHYQHLAKDSLEEWERIFYTGKADAFIELLKRFYDDI